MVRGVEVGIIFLCFWGVCFKIVFWSSWGRFWNRFGVHFGIKIWSKSKKNKIDFGIDFRCLAWKNDWLFPGRGGSGGPLICVRIFNKKKWKGSISTTVLIIVQEKGSTVLIIVQIIVELLNFDFHELMIWHALGSGPANFTWVFFPIRAAVGLLSWQFSC